LLPLYHPPDVPNKKIEQHELFEHIFGIWRSVVIGDEILTTGLDVCQAERILIIFSGIESFQFGTSCLLLSTSVLSSQQPIKAHTVL